jgi:hypothetical protein
MKYINAFLETENITIFDMSRPDIKFGNLVAGNY